MSKHHPEFAPSSLPRRILCPGSAGAESGLLAEETEDATEGSFLHEAVAKYLLYGKLDGLQLTDEQFELVKACAEVFKSVTGVASDMQIESLVYVKDNDAVLTFGTIDAAWVVGEKAYLFDWKFGRNPVDGAMANIQVATYALALHQTYGVKEVTAVVFQPRLNSSSSYTYTQWDAILGSIKRIIAKCHEPNAPRIPGEKQCQYCSARVVCPEAIRHLSELPALAGKDKLPSDPVALSDLYRKAKVAEKICEAIYSAVRSYAENNGDRCGSVVLTKGRTTRELTDLNKAYQKLYPMISNEEFVSCVKGVSIPELETLVAKKYGVKKQEAEERIKKVLGDLIETRTGNKTLKVENAATAI